MAVSRLFTIAIGIASIFTVEGLVRGLTRPPIPPGPLDRVVPILGRDALGETGPLSKAQFLGVSGRQGVFDWLGAARVSAGAVPIGGQTTFVPTAAVTSSLAGAFGLPMDEGVVISRRLWQGDLGAPGPDGEPGYDHARRELTATSGQYFPAGRSTRTDPIAIGLLGEMAAGWDGRAGAYFS